ncbi:MAG: glycosyltransferase family 2 protein [Gemmatimonadaceae bacterium]|nr:glycosyltransferase family 2 protein [Gemmatimonadaceae bacterium]
MKILVVLPVYNEEIILENNTLNLFDFLKNNLTDDWQIVLADNGSTDNTAAISKTLVARYPEKISYFYIPQKGRGGALRAAWLDFPADIYSYMDSDLATDLVFFPKLIEAVKNGYDVATGSRLLEESETKRSLARDVPSKIFNFLLKIILNFKIKDSQCGFKAISRKAAQDLVPKIQDNHWFFDTELLFLAQKNNYEIKELPVRWTEKQNRRRKSKVNVIKTALTYLKEIRRLKKSN